MADTDFSGICSRLASAFGKEFVERLERGVGKDFDEAVKSDPRGLLLRILEDIRLYNVAPLEMILEISDYMKHVHRVPRFFLAFSERDKLDSHETLDNVRRFVGSFYTMVDELGLTEELGKSTSNWWGNEHLL